jgi:hypothetical protein
MEVRYSAQGAGEVDVSGTESDSLYFVSQLLQGKGNIAGNMDGSPAPYDKFLKSIVIKTVPGQRLAFTVTEDGDLLVAGEYTGLEAIAGNLKWFVEKERRQGDHLHVEYYPDHFFLAENSIPIVFMMT